MTPKNGNYENPEFLEYALVFALIFNSKAQFICELPYQKAFYRALKKAHYIKLPY